MTINNDAITSLVKSYQEYIAALRKKLDLTEIRRLEEAQSAKEAAEKAAAAPKPASPAR
jgi:hypothetical protein